jgi:hypothetical protein
MADRDDLEARFMTLEPGDDELECFLPIESSPFQVRVSITLPLEFFAAKLGCEPIPSS